MAVYGVGHRAFLHAYCAIAVYLYYLVRSFVGITPEFRKGVGAVKYLLADTISVRKLQIALLLAQGTRTYLCYPTVDQVVSSVASIVFPTNCSTAGTRVDIFVSSHCGSSGIERRLESL